MPDSGVISASGEGKFLFPAVQAVSDIEVHLVSGTRIQFNSTASPRKLHNAAWYALGLAVGGAGGSAHDLVGYWRFMEFEFEDFNTSSQPQFADAVFWKCYADTHITIQVFWA